MDIYTSTLLVHHFHIRNSFLLWQPSGGCLHVQYPLRTLTVAGTREAIRSGSSRHLSTVSKTRFSTYTAGRLLSGRLLFRVYLFSSGVVRPATHDVSKTRKSQFFGSPSSFMKKSAIEKKRYIPVDFRGQASKNTHKRYHRNNSG